MKQVTSRPLLFVGLIVFFIALVGGMSVGHVIFQPKTVARAQTLTKRIPTACPSSSSCVSPSKKKKSPTPTVSATPTTQPLFTGFCVNVPVLLYHHIQPQEIAQQKGQTSLSVDSTVFDSQMAYLASNGYHTISAEELVNAIISHTQLPPKTVVVTADDAYLDNYTYAFPIIQKYHLILNLMVPTGLLGVSSGTNEYFTWDELNQMVGSGSVFVYNHTWSHYAMAQGPVSKDSYEITTAQTQLQQHFGKAAPIFVYPYGSGQTLPWVQAVIKQQGFVAAFSTLPGRYQCDSNLFALPRIHIGNAPLSSYGI